MKNIIIQNIKKFLGIIFFTGLCLYFIIAYENGIIPTTLAYFKWFFRFFIGDFGLNANGMRRIVLINFSDSNNLAIGLQYLHTVLLTILAIIFSFILASGLNFLIVLKKNNLSSIIKEIVEWFSNIHILILGIVMYSIFFNDISYFIGLLMISFGSTAFSQLSTLQFSNIKELYNKDFIVAARAWGDSIWKHMRRGVVLSSIDQLLSLWIIFFSNTMIFEIICQKPGLGYLLFKYFLDSKERTSSSGAINFIPEPNLFLAISMLIIITISLINMVRRITTFYLTEYRR